MMVSLAIINEERTGKCLLIRKLRYYGIDGKTRWIQNWLEDRQQTVVLDGVSSEAVSVDSGVPQGSVLGPGLNGLFEIHVVVDIKWVFFLHVA
jgi:hypothetical protein